MKLARHIYGFLKLEHTLFSLPLLFAGAYLGLASQGYLSIGLGFYKSLLIVLAGTGARTCALSLNRILDREFDARNPRTRARELPSGKLSLKQAQAIALAGFLLYMASAFLLGYWPLVLAPIPLLIFTAYPLMKRFTPLCHFGVGTGLCLAPLGGYIGSVDRFPSSPAVWWLAAFTFYWVSGFDTLYAIQDEKPDLRNRLHSLAADYGRQEAVRWGALLHAAALASLVVLAFFLPGHVRPFTWLALAPAALALAAEQKLGGSFSLESNARFFQVNALIGFLVLGFIGVGLCVP